jgi:hypothetical protein
LKANTLAGYGKQLESTKRNNRIESTFQAGGKRATAGSGGAKTKEEDFDTMAVSYNLAGGANTLCLTSTKMRQYHL